MNKIKNTLLGCMVGASILGGSCYSTGPEFNPEYSGDVNVSYVPQRIDDDARKEEMKFSSEGRLEQDLSKNTSVFLGGETAFYGGLKNLGKTFDDGLEPHRIESGISLGMSYKNIDFYVRHVSNHPIEGERKAIWYYPDVGVFDSPEYGMKNEAKMIINEYDYLEEIGIRIHFNGKLFGD